MADGPGKYDAYAEALLYAEGARGVLVIIVGGTKGMGCSMKSAGNSPSEAAQIERTWPTVLRALADNIEAQLKEDPRQEHDA